MAYEGNLKRTGSTATSSIRTSKAPSLQSLDTYKEQYCCFSKRTKCEKSLLITVTVLVIIIIVLIIVIAVLAQHIQDPSSKLSLLRKL
ncbi:hypothetical protein GWI33_012014 [Rhynchophorus ferrugineus]|uniref:Uncharacterized protein n=1 Tax=Rhynchophorus ferrugineus TaxID=354439 RepID=A0A834IB41_RHYFE|nr:hypothetical protein GWI33_012581 [Rhynchophorus ferrugineus]KAF7275283.1 hypothetical protein GWI33_012014 [Rhynchophorus ferrugineus]